MSTTPVRVPNLPPVRTRRALTGGQVAMIIIGGFLALLGLGLAAGGAAVAAADDHRDSAGYLTAGPATVATESYALAVPGLGVDVRGPDEAYARGLLGSIRIRATGADPDTPLFIGLARSDAAEGYLASVGHDTVSEIDTNPLTVRYAPHAGGAPAAPPTQQTFWTRSDTGTGTRTLDWEVSTGDWTVVVMNADGSRGVRADLDLGGTLPVLRWTTIGLWIGGAVFFLAGAVLVLLPLAGRRRASSA